MPRLIRRKKIIGTLVPLSALSSSIVAKKDQGTFLVGEAFLDWLQRTHQSAWQLLPLHQTQLESGSRSKRVPSPYKGYGVGLNPRYLSSYAKNLGSTNGKEMDTFIRQNKDWIYDYGLFCALTDHFGTDDWRKWEKPLRKRDPDAIKRWEIKLKKEIELHMQTQMKLHESYSQLKEKAKKKRISLIGDLPFYLSLNSPLVWANQNVFRIEKNGDLRCVSGMPESSFGRQVWGHPLYLWGSGNQRKRVVSFWKMRLRYLASLFDYIRFDHAKAFFEYGAMNAHGEGNDKFEKGPGYAVFKELVSFSMKCGLSVYAEDSGERVEELRKAMSKLEISGIKLFRFAFDERKNRVIENYADIAMYPENTVVYSSTHDTETLLGYLEKLSGTQKKVLANASHVKYSQDDQEFAARLRSALIASKAQAIIIPIQDWLYSTERINVPGTEKEKDDTNWLFVLGTPCEELPPVSF